MAKLYLKFEQSEQVLKEVVLTQAATTIGRLPDNNVQIDNLAVSGHHARISWEQNHYVVEDLGSLNGTYVNNERVGKATLKHGDQVKIGKHLVEFKHEGPVPNFAVAAKAGPSTPKLEATMLLDTKQSREKIADKGAPANTGNGPLGISRPCLDVYAICRAERSHWAAQHPGRPHRPGKIRAHRQDDDDRQVQHGVHQAERLFCAQQRSAHQQARQQIFHRALREQSQNKDQW